MFTFFALSRHIHVWIDMVMKTYCTDCLMGIRSYPSELFFDYLWLLCEWQRNGTNKAQDIFLNTIDVSPIIDVHSVLFLFIKMTTMRCWLGSHHQTPPTLTLTRTAAIVVNFLSTTNTKQLLRHTAVWIAMVNKMYHAMCLTEYGRQHRRRFSC